MTLIQLQGVSRGGLSSDGCTKNGCYRLAVDNVCLMCLKIKVGK